MGNFIVVRQSFGAQAERDHQPEPEERDQDQQNIAQTVFLNVEAQSIEQLCIET